MFGMNGFHVSASGAIQGHHGPLVWRRIYKNFFMSVQCKKLSFTNTMFIDRSKFQEHSKKGHSRNISMRLFQNLTNSYREDFSGICLCSYSQVAPIHQSHDHRQGQNFTNNF